MGARKERTVRLVVRRYGMEAEFGVRHAERLLRMGPLNGGWELPEGSGYIYDKVYGLRLRKDKEDTGEPVEAAGDQQGGEPAAPDQVPHGA